MNSLLSIKPIVLVGLLSIFSSPSLYADEVELYKDLPVCTSKKALTVFVGAITEQSNYLIDQLTKMDLCTVVEAGYKVDRYELKKFEGVVWKDNFYYTTDEMFDRVYRGVSL